MTTYTATVEGTDERQTVSAETLEQAGSSARAWALSLVRGRAFDDLPGELADWFDCGELRMLISLEDDQDEVWRGMIVVRRDDSWYARA